MILCSESSHFRIPGDLAVSESYTASVEIGHAKTMSAGYRQFPAGQMDLIFFWTSLSCAQSSATLPCV